MTQFAVHGSLFVGPYKGYHGRAEYDAEEGAYHGEVVDTKDVITFTGASPAEVAAEFKASVDDYLEFCKSRGEPAEKPYSGRILVRIEPKLHHDLCASAAMAGMSLNQFIAESLGKEVKAFAGRGEPAAIAPIYCASSNDAVVANLMGASLSLRSTASPNLSLTLGNQYSSLVGSLAIRSDAWVQRYFDAPAIATAPQPKPMRFLDTVKQWQRVVVESTPVIDEHSNRSAEGTAA